MKKYIVTALCLAAVLPSLAQTKRVMTVVQKDGTTKEYKVNSIQNVTFTDKELTALKNQWAYNDDAKDLSKVTMRQTADAYVFSLYGEDAEAPVLVITIPQAQMNKTIVLGSTDAEGVKVSYNGEEQALTGTVQARFDKTKKNVTITLEAETADYSDLRCKWNNNTFTQVYTATNTIKTTNVSEVGNYNIASALMVKPATTGAATSFAFGDAEATTADGLLSGKVGVAVSISASKLYNGTIDMATDADSYSFKYIDYSTRIVYDKVKAGTITTAQDANGKLYIKIEATMDDNRTVELEYYGATTEVESLDAMIPSAVAVNEYKYYTADGNVANTGTYGTSYIKQDTDKKRVTFYLTPEGETKGESKSYNNIAELQVGENLINGGQFDLSTIDQNFIFYFKYQALQVYTQSTNSYAPNGKVGTFEVKSDDNGTYEITLDISNLYTYSWSSKVSGDNTRVVLHYKGKLEQY